MEYLYLRCSNVFFFRSVRTFISPLLFENLADDSRAIRHDRVTCTRSRSSYVLIKISSLNLKFAEND